MDVELTVQMRNGTGKGAARRLRRTEMIPAVLYGPKMEATSLAVPAKRLEKLLRDMGQESKLLQLHIEGGEEVQARQALIREVQVHPVRRRFFHVDFYEVPLDRPIVVAVPVDLIGDSIGIKKGGTLNLIRRVIAVRCLPSDIPEKIPVDISALDLGDTIHISALSGTVPFELADDPNFAVVNIVAPEGKAEAEES
jgi:large subunit ribosomal protein L25